MEKLKTSIIDYPTERLPCKAQRNLPSCGKPQHAQIILSKTCTLWASLPLHRALILVIIIRIAPVQPIDQQPCQICSSCQRLCLMRPNAPGNAMRFVDSLSILKGFGMQVDALSSSPFMHSSFVAERHNALPNIIHQPLWATDHYRTFSQCLL